MDESKRKIISAKELKGKTIIFYRNDCKECQKMYPQLWMHQKVFNDSVFVNMNQKKNRSYVAKYHLTEVPKIIHN